MSKLRYFIPLCAALLSLTGCAEQNDNNILIKQSGEFTDETYIESMKGKNGKFDVTVVIKDAVKKCLQDASSE